MAVGVKGFQSGEAWNGNKGGRPKGCSFREEFTQAIAKAKREDMYKVVDLIFSVSLDDTIALKDRTFAIKLAHDFTTRFLTKPTNEVTIVNGAQEDATSLLTDSLKVEDTKQLQGIMHDVIQKFMKEKMEQYKANGVSSAVM